jgi:hypothetical protein
MSFSHSPPSQSLHSSEVCIPTSHKALLPRFQGAKRIASAQAGKLKADRRKRLFRHLAGLVSKRGAWFWWTQHINSPRTAPCLAAVSIIVFINIWIAKTERL